MERIGRFWHVCVGAVMLTAGNRTWSAAKWCRTLRSNGWEMSGLTPERWLAVLTFPGLALMDRLWMRMFHLTYRLVVTSWSERWVINFG